MLFLLSPAKKLAREKTPPRTKPMFIDAACDVMEMLKTLDVLETARFMKLSHTLAQDVAHQHAQWHNQGDQAALFMFNGDAYQGLDAKTLNDEALDYLQQYLLILSGAYGLLRPFDAVMPYRLEMGRDLDVAGSGSLYAFWQAHITQTINDIQPRVLVNVASNEYSKVLNRNSLKVHILDVRFEDKRNGIYKVIGFNAKRARGQLVRFAAQNGITDACELCNFDTEGWHYNADASSKDCLIFRREGKP